MRTLYIKEKQISEVLPLNVDNGLLYTRKSLDQLETSDIINAIRGFKTHQSNFKKRLDKVDFKIFDNLIYLLCKFDEENFEFEEELIAIDGSHSNLIVKDEKEIKLDINDDIQNQTLKHFQIKTFE